MIAIDTNILVYAHRPEAELHKQAFNALTGLISSGNPWGVPWPCVHEFIAVITNKRIFKTPTPLEVAFEAIRAWQYAEFLAEG